MGTLREVVGNSMINTKIIEFNYADNQIYAVFEIFGLVNQSFLTRDVYIVFVL